MTRKAVGPYNKNNSMVIKNEYFKKINFSDDIKINSSALTLGNFDGFHIGHQSLVSELINISGGLKKIIITFNPHTQKILANINNFNTITSHKYN